MPDMFGIISVIVLGCGLYGLYAYVNMKRGGKLNEALLLGKNLTEEMCKDKEEFARKALPAVLVFAITATVYGAIDTIHYFVMPIAILDFAATVIFMVVLIWYVVYTTKLKRKYF